MHTMLEVLERRSSISGYIFSHYLVTALLVIKMNVHNIYQCFL